VRAALMNPVKSLRTEWGVMRSRPWRD